MKIEIIEVDGKFYARKRVFSSVVYLRTSILPRNPLGPDHNYDLFAWVYRNFFPTPFDTAEDAKQVVEKYIKHLQDDSDIRKKARQKVKLENARWNKAKVVSTIDISFLVWLD